MTLYKKLSTALMLSFVTFNVLAQNAPISIFPKGCEIRGFGFSENFLVINDTGDQTYYLIQNHSNNLIELEHYETNPDVFMSPKLESKIAPSRWAAFASDISNTYFQCFKTDENQKVPVRCGDVLDVCKYPRVKFAVSNMGNYWVSTNKTQSQVVQDSINKGIFLRW